MACIIIQGMLEMSLGSPCGLMGLWQKLLICERTPSANSDGVPGYQCCTADSC